MTHQHRHGTNFLHIGICIILSIVLNNFQMKAQETNRMSDINLILERIMDTDQNFREKFNYAFEQFGDNSPEFILATKNLNISDSINQIQIDSIFSKYGWLTPPIVSEKASKAFFYVIQHAQDEFQKRYQPHVSLAFEKGIIDSLEFILYIDRFAVREQKYQKYGTQIMIDNIGNEYFVPIDTTNNATSNFLKEIELKMKNKNFVLFSNHNYIMLFIHSFNPNTNNPVSSLDIFLDDKKIGKTNAGGFFQTLITRKKGEVILTITNPINGKKQSMKLKFQEQIDFFDTYFGFRE